MNTRLYALAKIALTLVLVIFLAPDAGGQIHYSARIYALGGSAVSGIIPDYYTDLAFNPAYASLADALTINYGQRNTPAYEFPFFSLDQNLNLRSVTMYQQRTNEILSYGIEAKGWKFALIAEWRLRTSDETSSDIESYSSMDIQSEITTISRDNDKYHYAHGAISCSRYIGDDHALGLRLGTFTYYTLYSHQWSRHDERHRFTDQYAEQYLSYVSKRYSYDEKTRRWAALYLHMGLLLNARTESPSEVIFRVSLNDVFTRLENFNLRIQNEYEWDGRRTAHAYDRGDFIDGADGDVWSLDLWLKHMFGNGFRVFAGGGYRTAGYDGDWVHENRDYGWDNQLRDYLSNQYLTGEGDYSRISTFARMGKTARLERRIDLTAAIGGSFTRSMNDEQPFAYSTIQRTHDDNMHTVTSSNRIRFEIERLTAQLTLPLAVEFRPAPYVRLFGGFRTRVTWSRRTETCSSPAIFSDDMSAVSTAARSNGGARPALASTAEPTSVENCHEEVSTYHEATFGFSFNYRKRLVFDLYSGADLTPDHMDYLILDLRYRF